MFLESMKSQVRGKDRKVLYAEGTEKRVLEAAIILRDENLAKPILMGNVDEIAANAKELGCTLDGLDIHDPSRDEKFDLYVDEFFRLREIKGITKDEAAKTMRQPHYYGAMMVHLDAADGMVSGLSSKHKPFLPAFQIVGLREGFKRASSVFVLEWPERLLFFADCSVNINPDAAGLAEIAFATIETVKWLNVEPRVAFLSFSTRDSAKGPEVDKVKEATRLAKEKCPDVLIDGEVQFDTAMLPAVAKKKAPDSPFAGDGANVFIFPDLNSGNIAYKITERVGRARATGPILQGLRKPINDVSRGCSVEDLANVGVLTAALADIQY